MKLTTKKIDLLVIKESDFSFASAQTADANEIAVILERTELGRALERAQNWSRLYSPKNQLPTYFIWFEDLSRVVVFYRDYNNSLVVDYVGNFNEMLQNLGDTVLVLQ